MPAYTFHLIPHTHWDREWYLTSAEFLARLIPALDDVVTRLEADPEFRTFLLDGQTVLLEDYLRVRPDQEPRLRALVRAGRLQVGPWYVLADELIPSGESLLRNLLLGAADAARYGRRLEVLYSPDAFGHPDAWPTLAAEFGIPHGVLWRGLGGDPGQRGDLFRWRGPDAREVLLYHLPPDGYEAGAALPADPGRLPEAWAALRPTLLARAATPHVAVFVGADHHAAHPAVGALRRLLAALEPGHEVRVSRLDEFLAAAAAAAAAAGRSGLPTLEGELRWSYGYTWTLQGVHAARAPLKRRHSEAELRLTRVAEPLAALAELAGVASPRPLLEQAWRTLVQCQFHDTIGGCAADPVAREAELRLDAASSLAEVVARAGRDALTGHDPDRARELGARAQPRLLLWNPAARPREGVIVADVTWFRRDVLVGPSGGRRPREAIPPRGFALRGPGGVIGVQVLGRRIGLERVEAPHHYPDLDEVDIVRVAFRAPLLRGFALSLWEPVVGNRARPEGDAWARGRTVGNGLVELTLDDRGGWGLGDRRTGERYRELLRPEWGGDVGDCYTYCPPPRDRVRRAGPAASVRTSLGVADQYRVVAVHAGSPVVRCTIELEGRGRDYRLRLRAPTGVANGTATAGGAFGALARRPVTASPVAYPRETPVATAPAQRFVAHASGPRGLALLAPGFFEYECTPSGDLLFTLLRAVGQLSRADLATRPGHAAWPTATPLAQCQGRERLQVALCAITEADLLRGTVLPELWEDLFLGPRAEWLRQTAPLGLRPAGLRLEGEGLVFSALKPSATGGGVVARCYNAGFVPTAGAWHLDQPIARARRTRADESQGGEVRLEAGGRTIRFTAGPRELVTLVLEPAVLEPAALEPAAPGAPE